MNETIEIRMEHLNHVMTRVDLSHFPGEHRPVPTPVRGPTDNLETQPMDIMGAEAPTSPPPPLASPGLSADQHRKKFKAQCKPEKVQPPQPARPPPSAAIDLDGPGHAED